MIPFLLHLSALSDEELECISKNARQALQTHVQVAQTSAPCFPFTYPDAEHAFPYSFLLRFLTVSPAVHGDQTLCETTTETGDGRGPTKQDSADDEDVTDDPDTPGTAYVIADSNDKEDADY